MVGAAREPGPFMMMDNSRPCSAAEAVQRAYALAHAMSGCYALGTGNWNPETPDKPWTVRERDGLIGCDCAGLICFVFKLRRHRPGFNKAGRFDVEDDINSNSMLGDAFSAQELFTHVVNGPPLPGDVIAYPSFYLYEPDGRRRADEHGTPFHYIGHVALVVGTERVTADWKAAAPDWRQLDIIQVCGPDRRAPAAIRSDGSVFFRHDAVWPKPEHRAWLLRVVP